MQWPAKIYIAWADVRRTEAHRVHSKLSRSAILRTFKEELSNSASQSLEYAIIFVSKIAAHIFVQNMLLQLLSVYDLC